MAKRYDQATIKKVLDAKSKGNKTVAEICKDFGVSKQTLFKWQRNQGTKSTSKKSTNRVQAIKAQIEKLKVELADAVLQEA